MPKGLVLTIIVVLQLMNSAIAQKAEETVVLRKGKDSKFYTLGGNNIPEVINCGDAGIVLIKDEKYTFYNSDFKEKWSIDAIHKYKLGRVFFSEVYAGGEKYFYSVQSKLKGSFFGPAVELNIIQVSLETGQVKESMISLENNKLQVEKVFVTEDGVNMFSFELNSKEKEVKYYLSTFNHATLAYKQTQIKLPSNEKEDEAFKAIEPSHVRRYLWNPFLLDDGKLLLGSLSDSESKSEGVKVKLSYVFCSLDGMLDDVRTVDVPGEFNFAKPQFKLDVKNNLLYCFGYLFTKRGHEGIYLIVENINEKKRTSYVVPFADLNDKYKFADDERLNITIFERHAYLYKEDRCIGQDMVFVNSDTKTISLGLMGGYTSINKSIEIRRLFFGANGQLVKMDRVTNYGNSSVSGYVQLPGKIVDLWGSDPLPLQQKFIENLGQDKRGESVVFFVGSKGDRMILIEETESRITGYKIVK